MQQGGKGVASALGDLKPKKPGRVVTQDQFLFMIVIAPTLQQIKECNGAVLSKRQMRVVAAPNEAVSRFFDQGPGHGVGVGVVLELGHAVNTGEFHIGQALSLAHEFQ